MSINQSELDAIKRDVFQAKESRENAEERRERKAVETPKLLCILHTEIKLAGRWHHLGMNYLPSDPEVALAIGGEGLLEQSPFMREARYAPNTIALDRRKFSASDSPTDPTILHMGTYRTAPRAHSGCYLPYAEMKKLADWLEDLAADNKRDREYVERCLGLIYTAAWNDEDVLRAYGIEDARGVFFFVN